MISLTTQLNNLPTDIGDKIYKMKFDMNLQEVHTELNNTRPTYPGDFSQHPDDFMKKEGPCAYQVITELDAWDIMKVPPPHDTGYTFWNNPKILEIGVNINARSTGHSGASFGFLMQHMHYIAVNGWNVYYKKFIELSS